MLTSLGSSFPSQAAAKASYEARFPRVVAKAQARADRIAARHGAAAKVAVQAARFLDRLRGGIQRARDTLVGLGTHAAIAARAARHLAFGMPSAATRDNPNDYLMVRNGSITSYNRERNAMNWVSWNVRASDFGNEARTNDFRSDPSLPRTWYHPSSNDFTVNGTLTRGHMVRSGERTVSANRNSKTFLFSNLLPQSRNNNAGPWNALEDYYRAEVSSKGLEAHIIAGGVFGAHDPAHKVQVPKSTWKIVALTKPGEPITARTRLISVIIPNNDHEVHEKDNFDKYRVAPAEIERQTGLNLFSSLPAHVAAALRARVDQQPVAPAVDPAQRFHLHADDKHQTVMAHNVSGTVRWYSDKKGYGFVTKQDGSNVFVHMSRLDGVETLKQGQRVTFDQMTRRKSLSALRVRPAAPLVARRVLGEVIKFDVQRGFGFIRQADGQEVFVHVSSAPGKQALQIGQRLIFDVAQGAKGLAAESVEFAK